MSYKAKKISQQIVVEDFDEDKEDMALKKQMKQKFDVSEKFKDLYKNKLSGQLDKMVIDRCKKTLDQHYHSYRQPCESQINVQSNEEINELPQPSLSKISSLQHVS